MERGIIVKWRKASKRDVGQLARFCDFRDDGEWWFGILIEVAPHYICQHGAGGMNGEREAFAICEVVDNARD